MKNQRRTLVILLIFLLASLSCTLILAMHLERTPSMQRIAREEPFTGQKMELDTALDNAVDLIEKNNLAAAENLLSNLIKQYPASSDVWMLSGSVFFRQGKYKDAEKSFRHLLRQHPNSAAGFNNLSETLIKLGRLNEARIAITQALQLEPNNAEILLNAASLYARLKDDKTALVCLKKAMDRGVTAEQVSMYMDLVRLLERPDFMNYYRQKQSERSNR